MDTVKYARKPFDVEAVQVTAENIEEVAAWCGGTVEIGGSQDDTQFIKVSVARVLNERQTKAFYGDWVLKAGTGFKVYTAKAFHKAFEPLTGVAADNAVQATKQPVIAVG